MNLQTDVCSRRNRRRTWSRIGLAAATLVFAGHAAAQVTLYDREGFRGRALAVNGPINDFSRVDFNDRASSVVVDRGRWQVCEDARFNGRCVVLQRGSYDSLRSMGLENRVSSIRPLSRPVAGTPVPPPMPQPDYAWRQRPNERLFEAPVRNVRAVTGPPEQRCWVEQQAVAAPPRPDVNVPGAIIGGVLGGILGHQVGGGSGRTVATIGGAVGGGALGANIDRIRGANGPVTRDVRRCDNVPGSAQVQYYDVDYDFRGVSHHVQMSTPPGRTITVNGRGEPRS